MTVYERDNGAEALLRTLHDFGRRGDKRRLDVGVVGRDAAKEESPGVTVADVATWAEYGLGQPQRSWLRGWIDENEAEIDKRIGIELRKVIEGKQDPRRAMLRIGVWMVGEIQTRIANGIQPPNAASTIARKGSSTPLIDEGLFRTSITSRVVNDG